jgi:hypothetical protein
VVREGLWCWGLPWVLFTVAGMEWSGRESGHQRDHLPGCQKFSAHGRKVTEKEGDPVDNETMWSGTSDSMRTWEG